MLIPSAQTGLQKALLAIIAAGGVAPAEGADDSYIIEEIRAVGPGCPPGTFDFDAEGQHFVYDEMILWHPDPAGRTVQYTNCLTTIAIDVAEGIQVSVAHARARGHATLDPGIVARHTMKFFFAGDPSGAMSHTELTGPFDDDYDLSGQLSPGGEAWSTCGEPVVLGIDSSLQLNASHNPAGTAELSVDRLDMKIQARRC
ncbi:DUF4360 domain-containing protein [Nannocystis punicea]|uniref:DUF4360 domain-containing protein n=1 Tax=Nannocystis punicea TaxID=2995304 RepID=A0ABY7GYM2_9BACT|nr:DUF4360 domain-containing protein [Nannocystis poenicansa]WAS92098.1 DUF4360 domain-containing protein [Nannocystis poenicansa]